MHPVVDEAKCTGCGECVEVCPAEPNVFELKDKKAKVVHPEECIDCGACEDACPEEAIELVD